MHIIYNLLFILAAWRWGDWRSWKTYYPTILFFILCDLLHNFFAYNHTLWMFHERLLSEILSKHSFISLLIMIAAYPSTILIYLYHFYRTNDWSKRIIHYFFWIILYPSIEYAGCLTGYITYAHGWNLGYSLLLLMLMFFLFPLHHKKPLLAWVITVGIIGWILTRFGFSPEHMK